MNHSKNTDGKLTIEFTDNDDVLISYNEFSYTASNNHFCMYPLIELLELKLYRTKTSLEGHRINKVSDKAIVVLALKSQQKNLTGILTALDNFKKKKTLNEVILLL